MPKVVALDPGHGVDTPGKRSPDGTLREYEFAGDVAARAKKLLEAQGVKVVLTRPTTADAKDVALSKRVKIANDAGAALFVSIHSNAHGNGREWTGGRGYETYVYAYGGQAEKLARRLVDEAKRLIVPFGVPLRNPTVKTAAFYVLKHTRMPAVLIEHAFHTHQQECQLLKRDDFRQACAEHIARAVCAHLGIRYDLPEPNPEPKPAPAQKPGPFKDVPADDPDADTFARLKAAGILAGYPDGTVRPEETITMRRLAKMLDRVLHRQG